MRLLAINGSLRAGSFNALLLGEAAAVSPAGVDFAVLDGIARIPAYNADLDTLRPPPPVAALRREIAEADAVLIATPEYNGSIPGALKNALDWASRPFATNPFRGKRVAVVGASTGLLGAAGAQTELRKVLGVIGADVLGALVAVPSAQAAFTSDGRLRDPRLTATMRSVVEQLIGAAERAA